MGLTWNPPLRFLCPYPRRPHLCGTESTVSCFPLPGLALERTFSAPRGPLSFSCARNTLGINIFVTFKYKQLRALRSTCQSHFRSLSAAHCFHRVGRLSPTSFRDKHAYAASPPRSKRRFFIVVFFLFRSPRFSKLPLFRRFIPLADS